MYKKPSKKQLLIRRIAVSTLATVAVGVIATASILFMLGYRLDSDNGRLKQGALLQFETTPSAARVLIDDTYIGSQTATKQTVVAGTHAITMTKAGYENWNRTLSLDAGTLTWLDYARLVPTERPVEVVGQYKTLAGLRFSEDLKWALAQENAALPTFRLIDLRDTKIKSTFLTLNSEVYTQSPDAPHLFAVARWSNDGRYALIKHTYENTRVEWLMLDTQDVAKTINITRTLGADLTDVKFARSSGMSLYGLTTEGTIRKLDLSGETISRPLVSNVISFAVFEENSVVSYIASDPTNDKRTIAGIYKDGESAARVLRTAQVSNKELKIAIGRYFGEDYVAIAEGDKVDILTGSLPSANSTDASSLRMFAKLTTEGAVTSLSFSDKSDYILAQSGNKFTSYELEHKRSSKAVVPVAEGATASTLKWLDSAHLWNDDNGFLVMRDFDNANVHSIMRVESGFDASLSQNGRFFYGVGKNADGTYQLQRVRMILN